MTCLFLGVGITPQAGSPTHAQASDTTQASTMTSRGSSTAMRWSERSTATHRALDFKQCDHIFQNRGPLWSEEIY